MINPQALQKHIDEYAEIVGLETDRFVCPITLHKCDEPELINGHILNQALVSASRRQVIQYGKVDGFYGTRIEPELVNFLNAKEKSTGDLLRSSKNLQIEFSDGSTARAFAAVGRSAKAASRKLPLFNVPVSDDDAVPVFIVIDPDDSRLDGPKRLVGSVYAIPSHWVAGMLKAAFLAMFDMIGYRLICDPLGNTLRTTLASYYNDNGSGADADRYFSDFFGAVKLLGMGSSSEELRQNYKPFGFDSIDDRMVLLHYLGTDQKLMFAATMIFKVNETTVTITIPQYLAGADIAFIWGLYRNLLIDTQSVNQSVYRAQFKGEHWSVEQKPINIMYEHQPGR